MEKRGRFLIPRTITYPLPNMHQSPPIPQTPPGWDPKVQQGHWCKSMDVSRHPEATKTMQIHHVVSPCRLPTPLIQKHNFRMHHLEKDLKDVWSAKVQQAAQHAISSPLSLPAFNPNRLGEAKFHKSHGFRFPETAPGPPGPTLFGMSFQETLHQIGRQWRKRTGNLDTQTISFQALPKWKGKRHSEINILNKTNYATELPFLVTSLLIWLPFPCKNHKLRSISSRGTAFLWFTSPSFHLWTKVPLIPWCSAWKSTLTMRFTKTTWPRSTWKWLRLHQRRGGLVACWLAKNHWNRGLGSYSKYMMIYVALAMACYGYVSIVCQASICSIIML